MKLINVYNQNQFIYILIINVINLNMNRLTNPNISAARHHYPLQQDIYPHIQHQILPQYYQDPYARYPTPRFSQQKLIKPRSYDKEEIYEENIDKIAFEQPMEQPMTIDQPPQQYQNYNMIPIEAQQNLRRVYGDKRLPVRTEQTQQYLQPRQYNQYGECNQSNNRYIYQQDLLRPEYYQDRLEYQNPRGYHNFNRQPLGYYEEDLQYYPQENQNINIQRRDPRYDQQSYFEGKKMPLRQLPKENLLIEKRMNNTKIMKNQNMRSPNYNQMIYHPQNLHNQKLRLPRPTERDYYPKYEEYYERPYLSRSSTVQNLDAKRLYATDRDHLYGSRQSRHPSDYHRLLEMDKLRNYKSGYPYDQLSRKVHHHYR